ncbi:MAG: hypothetical protein MUF61_01580 [archaeon]|jgi:hypothetical protein|nr:hypothetical protein [archaeon]
MKKGIISALILMSLLIMSSVSALDISVDKADKGSVLVSELKNPAVFDFTITNRGANESVEIYSLIGVSFSPRGNFVLSSGKSTVRVEAYPSASIRSRTGIFTFEYQIKGIGADLFKDQLTLTIVQLKDTLKITPQSVHYGDTSATITIENLQNTNLDKVKLVFSSALFNGEKEVSLQPYKKMDVSIPINTDKIKAMGAGSYVIKTDVDVEGADARFENVVSYLEMQGTSITREASGWIIRTTTTTKKNEGNTVVKDVIGVNKNVLTRLFTTFSQDPVKAERNALFVSYTWEKDLKPNDSWSISSTTNYTLPFILVLVVILAALAVFFYTRTSVILKKRVSYVRTSGGNFALKVKLHLKARKGVEHLHISDRIPHAMKLYQGAGMPHKIDEQTRRIMWEIDHLNAGEERIFSYIIYTNIKIVGRYELPSASATFTKNGKHESLNSNRTFFISEH